MTLGDRAEFTVVEPGYVTGVRVVVGKRDGDVVEAEPSERYADGEPTMKLYLRGDEIIQFVWSDIIFTWNEMSSAYFCSSSGCEYPHRFSNKDIEQTGTTPAVDEPIEDCTDREVVRFASAIKRGLDGTV